MFDDIERMARIAVDEVQCFLREEALSRGENYRPRQRPITLREIMNAFWIAHGEYNDDKTLSKYAPEPDDPEKDKFKRMLSAISYQRLYRYTGYEPVDDDVRIMRHLLGHIFSWRKHGKLSVSARKTATKMQLVKGK